MGFCEKIINDEASIYLDAPKRTYEGLSDVQEKIVDQQVEVIVEKKVPYNTYVDVPYDVIVERPIEKIIEKEIEIEKRKRNPFTIA